MKEFLRKISSLDRIHQWEERDSVIRESVSQHSFKVSAIAIYLLNDMTNKTDFIIKHYNVREEWERFKYECVSYAVLHDFDEAIIGRDISHVVKYNEYNGDKIREILNDYVEHNISKFSPISNQPSEKVKCFVKLCDWIALLTFINRNKDMGVRTFDSECEYCKNNILNKINEVTSMLKEEYNIDYQLTIIKDFYE